MAVLHRLALPGVAAYVNPDRAVEGTDAALHAAGGIRHNLTSDQRLAARLFLAEELF